MQFRVNWILALFVIFTNICQLLIFKQPIKIDYLKFFFSMKEYNILPKFWNAHNGQIPENWIKNLDWKSTEVLVY